MKKIFYLLLLLFLTSKGFSAEIQLTHSYNADYSLFPENKFKNSYVQNQLSKFQVNYSVQSVYVIPKIEASGYSCEEILSKLDQMGGLDKEAYGVSYIDSRSGERKPIFKKSSYTIKDALNKKGELYVKDKAAGGLLFDVSIDKYVDVDTYYLVYGLLKESPTNFFVRGIKKEEASIFVLMQENESEIRVYALMQSKYSPANHRFLKSFVEGAVSARVIEIENWFYRMLCTCATK